MFFIVHLNRGLLTDQHLSHSCAEGVRLALLLFVSIHLMTKNYFGHNIRSVKESNAL